MSQNNDDFWKDLLGENSGDELSGETEQKSEEPVKGEQDIDDKPLGNLGFTVEYVSRDADKITPEPQEQSVPEDDDSTRRIPTADAPSAEEKEDRYIPPEKKPADTPKTGKYGAHAPEKNRFGRDAGKRTTDNLPESVVGPQNFEVDFDFDSEYDDVDEKIVRRGRTKKTGCLGGILYFLFIICISAVLAFLGWKAAKDVLGLDGENEQVEVTLPGDIFTTEQREETKEDGTVENVTVSKADMEYVTNLLYEKGLVEQKWVFKLFADFSHADEKVREGTYQLNMNYDYRALVNGMTSAGGIRVETDVTIPEGYTVKQIITLLDSKEVCDEDDLKEVLANHQFDYDFLEGLPTGEVNRLEGFLFPDTYTFYVGDDPVRVVNKLLANFKVKWTEEYQTRAEAMGYTAKDIVTVASLIEKEAGNDAERGNIASVIYNRLNNPGTQGTVGFLQIDASIYYAIEATGEEFSKDLDNPYNTYLYKGLTPGPIANPGLASIKAALYPENTQYYYYALGKNKSHEFFKTFDGFTNFVNSDEYGG